MKLNIQFIKNFLFKTFLLYLCYCLNEQFKENLNNHLVDN